MGKLNDLLNTYRFRTVFPSINPEVLSLRYNICFVKLYKRGIIVVVAVFLRQAPRPTSIYRLINVIINVF